MSDRNPRQSNGLTPRQHAAHYRVGIDLGTTHTVVAFADADAGAEAKIQLFPIEQLVAAGEVAALELLPSVRYHPAEGELDFSDVPLPWSRSSPSGVDGAAAVIGEFARTLGAKSQGRLVASAKSWLSHPSVDRTAAVLPWGAPEGVPKISPVDACASYLAHVRQAWNWRFPAAPLEQQELVLTVPASFDDGARALTMQAMQQAGLTTFRLLEEPQAACYDWLWRHRKVLAEALADIRLILVCDVGGGTTDFTLIRVDPTEGEPRLTRMGVGNHLMLGGDNIDWALAHHLEEKLLTSGGRLSGNELAQLVAQCRAAKECLLAADAPESSTVTLLGSGSRLVGGARSVAVDRQELLRLVLDGFFPLVGRDDFPERKRSGVVELGLPYVADPAFSRHLAAFLAQHSEAALDAQGRQGEGLPDAVLLNGGVFGSALLAERLMQQLDSWGAIKPLRLDNEHPDQAVAVGAVAYSLARSGLAVRKIGGGSARSYFLLVDTDREGERHGVCLLPRGTEEGIEMVLADRRFSLKVGQPVRFHLFCSTADTSYHPGDLAVINTEQFIELPPLAAVFENEGGDCIVGLTAEMSEIGVLELRCVSETDSHCSWKVEFQLRPHGSAPQVPGQAHPHLDRAEEQLRVVFGRKVRHLNPKALKGLRSTLEKSLGVRESWDTGLCRSLFAVLLEGLPHRRRSADHERLWLNLAGYCLRPGFGEPADEWRVGQVYGIYRQGLQFVNEVQNWAEWWTLWRRIAGGLSADAQAKIFDELADFIDPAAQRRGNLAVLAKKRSYEDMVRLSASLERLTVVRKIELGTWLLERLRKPGEPRESWWALGRVGSRVLFHGSAHGVVPRETADRWLTELLRLDWKRDPSVGFAATLIARKSGDRNRDIQPSLADAVMLKLRAARAPDAWLNLVGQVQSLNATEERRMFGEALPPGLTLVQ